MKIHEYQAKELLREFGVSVLPGALAQTPAEAHARAGELGGTFFAVKAQIHAGGRGKGGGIKTAKTPDEVRELATKILGMQLVTPQTGPEGQRVQSVYIETGAAIDRELYLALLNDSSQKSLVFIASPDGGMDIEAIAATHPERIYSVPVNPVHGYSAYIGRRLAKALSLSQPAAAKLSDLAGKLVRFYKALDASLVEINPLVVTKAGELFALDAKVTFDDNALARNPRIVALRDPSEEHPLEVEASKFNLNYINLDGTIGCMVNGAGLAMATMDIIKLNGEEPANFLDVGGGATQDAVTQAFRILTRDPRVQGILVNIFGGIVKCDVIANGILAAARDVQLKVPLVVRLEGTNSKEGLAILASSGLSVIPASSMAQAAEEIVARVRKNRRER